MARWVIAYDIADPERLRRVHDYLKRRAFHLQYSVFLADASDSTLGDLLDDLRVLIDEGADDIRVYRIPASPWWRVVGRRPMPESIELLGPLTPDRREGPDANPHES